jgi:RNA polymerase primary sigma factor
LVAGTKAGEPDATEQLVDAFMPAIDGVAYLYRRFACLERTELRQEGVVGLLRAAKRYDHSYGTPFWAYASWWVRQAMQQLVSELTRPVVLSDRAVRHLARIKDAQRHLVQSNGKEPSVEELASRTGLERAQVENLIAAERMPRGLEEPIGGEAGAGSFGELLADPRAEDAYERVPRRMIVESLKGVFGGLTERERLILCGRFGFDGPELTLRELGATLGVSAERVRQIEQRALEKLRVAADSGLTPAQCGPTNGRAAKEGSASRLPERNDNESERRAMTTLMEPVAPWLRDLNRLFTSEGNTFLPPADVLVTDEGVTVSMDVPGIKSENLEIELENDVLTIRGERPNPYQAEEGNGKRAWRRIERGFGRFERSIRVPRGLNPDAIEAALHDGVLVLRIPKPEELKPRRIQVHEQDSSESREQPQVEGATS